MRFPRGDFPHRFRLLTYLHIPFCHRVCPYCSFYKHTPGSTPIGAFVDALAKEAAYRLPPLNTQPRTLYLGGGTPSMLSPTHLERLFGALREQLDFAALDEITMEANPATFDLTKARLFRELGVTRVSLGIQSFTPHVLQTLGREHDPEQAAEAVAILREAGMPSVNIDLMFSIPGQSIDDWRETLERTISLNPDHVSAYNLTYEEDTAFFESLKRGEMNADEDRDASFYHLAHRLLTSSGYDHYETSNYARPGHHSSHNRGYWQGEDYIGLGPSAVSTIERVRSQNVADTARYVEMVNGIGHAITGSEAIDPEAWRIERIALGLRTREGIPLDRVDSRAETLQSLVDAGYAVIQDGRLVLTEEGSALVDPIAGELV
ncbi:radical SAM family heme chaperone HemW [Luteolibacter ambystomatis]|uniref:Heme chaperone HemW n=1 Tax=Luteolibacter ambystomatis TaxID=2824561 RepID=A0A975J3H1_9BACT|nr:radical SAM family heme chaperone HemW [Luteolibacter ambystomatis]